MGRRGKSVRGGVVVIGYGLLWGCGQGALDDPGTRTGEGGQGGGMTAGVGAGGMGGAAEADCPPGEKPGPLEGAVGELTDGGIRYNVRTPADYEPTRAHPLLVVYSPRVNDATAEALEAFTGLAPDATERGYVAAFVEWFDPVPAENRADAATIRTDVADTWCIDRRRVYVTGHSDGGSMATLFALQSGEIAAIAPSAAGIDEDDGPAIGCNGPIPAMVVHSADDMVFPPPSFGLGAADFWASCSSCGALGAPGGDGCASYADCVDESEVRYCEVSGSHYEWYGLNQLMLDFFDRHELPER